MDPKTGLLRTITSTALLLACFLSNTTDAAFTIQFDPAQTTVQSNGADQTGVMNLVIQNTGATSATFSGMTFRLNNPGDKLTYSTAATQTDSFPFDQVSQVKLSQHTELYSLGVSSTSQQHTLAAGETKTLLSVSYELDGSVDTGTFDLDLTLIDAKEGIARTGNLANISPTVSVIDNLFVVNNGAAAIPEPGSFLLIATAIAGAAFHRTRRRSRKHSAPHGSSSA